MVSVDRYGSRTWAVREGRRLLAVTVYRKGALALAGRVVRARQDRLELLRLRRAVAELPVSPAKYLVDPPAWDRVVRLLAGNTAR